MLNADEKRERKRVYLKEWRARKLLEDPGYNSRHSKKWRDANLDRARAHDRARLNKERRDLTRDWYARNREERKAIQREYTLAHKDDLVEYNTRRKATPEVQARRKLARAVRYGKVTKPTHCPLCSRETPAREMHAHHNDYSKPLDVEWLCCTCHGKRHRID